MSSSGEINQTTGNTEANPPWGSLQGIETSGSVKLTTTVLTGLNYQQWANAIEIALEGRGLYEFITGEFQKPNQTAQPTQYKKWRKLDCQVLTVLQNSIDPKISEMFFNQKTLKDLWDAITKHYGKRRNHSHIYHLKRTVQRITQNQRTILEYSTDLRRAWEELKVYLLPTDDPNMLQERENEQVYQFLGGLDDSYEAIRAQILLSAKLPHLDDVMARIQGEETRREARLRRWLQLREIRTLDLKSGRISVTIAKRRDTEERSVGSSTLISGRSGGERSQRPRGQ